MTLVKCSCAPCERLAEVDGLGESLCGECLSAQCRAFGDGCMVARVTAVLAEHVCDGCDGSGGVAHGLCAPGETPCSMCEWCRGPATNRIRCDKDGCGCPRKPDAVCKECLPTAKRSYAAWKLYPL